MKGTPEGRYFAARTASYYASGERENVMKLAGQQKDLAASETWFKGYTFHEIGKQLSNIVSVLAHELPSINYYIQRGSEGAGVDNLSHAASTFNLGAVFSNYDNEPTINSEQLYVALRVTEEYVTERTATPQVIHALRRDIKKVTKHQEPKYKLKPTLLRQGIIFLREKVESTLTQEERERTESALE